MAPKKTDSAKKRKLAAKQRRHRARLVNISDEIDRWKQLKAMTSAKDDSFLAKILIDCYLERHTAHAIAQMSVPHASTPKSTRSATMTAIAEPDVSSVSTDSDADVVVAGPSLLKRRKTDLEAGHTQIKPSPLSVEDTGEKQMLPGSKKKHARVDIELSSTELEDFCDPDYDPDDPTYQPHDWVDISIVDCQLDDECLEEQGVEDAVFDFVCEGQEEVIEEEVTGVNYDAGVAKLKEVNEDVIREEKYVVTKRSLDTLMEMFPQKHCSVCGKLIKRVLKTVGCIVDCKWSCDDGHLTYRWASSAMLPDGVYSTNLLAMSSIVLSGNNYTKIALFAKFLGLAFPSRTSFNRIQTKCVLPVVDTYWGNLKQSALEEHRAVKVTVSGDGRMDSPGHTAKYCTYTVMNQADKVILALEVVDKRETGLKSVLMEAKGFGRAMKCIQDAGVELGEVVTDAHPQISKIMRTSFPEVRHSYDMWHGAKNLGKRMSKVAAVKGNEALTPWLKDLTNNFFHCAETCNGNVLHMKTKWVSILNHVTNCHSWALGHCDHGPIEEERENKPWLKSSSNAVKDLEKQVMDKRLLRTFPYYVTCQTTSELESFNNHLLMYAPKRNAFSYAVYKCRCQLAAIDYTKHLQRTQVVDKDGNPKWRRTYSKAASNWTVHPIKEAKKYSYIPGLQLKIAELFCAREDPLRSKVTLGDQDPKRIRTNIAPVSPKPTTSLAENLVSRIKKKQ